MRFDGYEDTYLAAASADYGRTMAVMGGLLGFAIEAHVLRQEATTTSSLVADFCRWLIASKANHPTCVFPGYCASIRYMTQIQLSDGSLGSFAPEYGTLGMSGLIAWYDEFTQWVAREVRRLRAERAEKNYPPPAPPPAEVMEVLRLMTQKWEDQARGE